jgi:hypothetical protein
VAEPGGRTPDLLNAIRDNRSTLALPWPFSSGPNRLHFKDFRIKPGFQITHCRSQATANSFGGATKRVSIQVGVPSGGGWLRVS